ncbi:glycerate kinase [Microbacterium deminutum]|uniref:Glycerate kinase n=1 Tax=Microbacterium deminutum TaxID=344164 RepID=A0ABP5C9C5_9MICO
MHGDRRYLVAPDKYKGTLTAIEAAKALADGIRRADPGAVIVELPFADGGEGTVDAVVAGGGERRVTTVRGPLGDPVAAAWAIRHDTAFVELAEASGLRLVSQPDGATALAADTWGVGELIRAALDAGVAKIVIGVGGSATTDGASGALRALGFRFVDGDGADVNPVESDSAIAVDSSRADPRLRDTQFELCADVLSPMTGDRGAARIFGPQKGADAATVEVLDERLELLAGLYATVSDADILATGGAAGGFSGGAMAVLGAHVRSGVDSLAEILGLEQQLGAADVVVVGEGSMDEQSRFGKTPVGIARKARAHDVPVIAVPGISPFTGDDLAGDGIVVISTAAAAARADGGDSLAEAAKYVSSAAEAGVTAYLSMLSRRSTPSGAE